MPELLFRLYEAPDGRIFALFSHQSEAEELFDHACQMVYREDKQNNQHSLSDRVSDLYSVRSYTFEFHQYQYETSITVATAFDQLISELVVGVDVFFCSDQLTSDTDQTFWHNIFERYRSTDFVVFNRDEFSDERLRFSPYRVAHLVPRYPDIPDSALQHRIYCKGAVFVFFRVINEIIRQRDKDNGMGHLIRSDIDGYISENVVPEKNARQVIDRFMEVLKKNQC